ncbi:teicoplanin resistance protein VanZ [Ideonella sp.]|uniref:VanZ family protein n=1 Tax=Ideonella sp. TaxID=1929293 RepID=UPI0035ADC1C9
MATATATPPPHRSSAPPLAALALAVVVYASLYPFTGWRWPAGASWLELVWLPLPPQRYRFDIWANFVGYVPVAALVHLAGVRSGWRAGRWAVGTVLVMSGLSFANEFVQQFLPLRYPSRLDWALNSGGALAGVTLSMLLLRLGGVERWERSRDRWFGRHGGGALALLLAWPLGLLFPTPLPLGLGPSWARLQDRLATALEGVRGAEGVLQWLANAPVPDAPLPALAEVLAVTLGLLGPCLLAHVVTAPGWRRLVMSAGAAALGLAAATLSAALNFGPAHALAWLTPAVMPAVGLALGLAFALWRVPPRLAAVLGVATVSAGMMLVAQAPADPYFASSLQAWEQGRFIHFHGLAQWVGWLWPLAALGWLLADLSHRERRP